MLAAVPQLLTEASLLDGEHSNPHSFTQVGDLTYFVATSEINSSNEHEQLWRTDGTAAGTQQVMSLEPGAASTQPQFLTNINGALFFIDDIAGAVDSLWKVEGPNGVAVRATDAEGNPFSNVHSLTEMNGVFYFAGSAGGAGIELWRTDGTTAGTWLVKDIWPGAVSGIFDTNFIATDDTLYFRAGDGISGLALWKSDGTEAGTTLVKGMEASGPGSVYPWLSTQFTRLGNVVYFAAGSGSAGLELWRSDGTEAGTYLVKDVYSGPFPSNLNYLTAFGTSIFFSAQDQFNGYELWRSDGTEAGTRMVKNIGVSSNPHDLTIFNGQLYFSAKFNGEFRLWRTDGTELGTVEAFASIPPASPFSLPPTSVVSGLENLTVVNDRLYFAAAIGPWSFDNATLFSYDGTAAAPSKVLETTATTFSPIDPTNLSVTNGKLMFSARRQSSTGSSNEPWLSDGTAAGTRQIIDLTGRATGSSINGIYNADGRLFFNGTPSLTSSNLPSRLWTYGGAEEGPAAIGTFTTSNPNNFWPVAHLGSVYLYANLNPAPELWRSDGTVAGTYRIKTMYAGPHTGIADFAELGGVVYFAGAGGSQGYELWRSDGTEAGTWLVKDLNPGLGNLNGDTFPRPPLCMTTLGNAIYFSITSGATRGLWKSDGTAEGTGLVKEFNGEAPAYLTVANGALYFAVSHDASGNVLWKSDGTEAGTVVVKSSASTGTMTPRYSSMPKNLPLPVLHGEVFFVAGNALWKTDGSDEGTVLVKDGQPYGSTFFQQFQYLYPIMTAVGDLVYFVADDGVHGRELWKSDGTTEGTALVKDIHPSNSAFNSIYSFPAADVSGTLYFVAQDGNGWQVWRTNGAEAGTFPATSMPMNFAETSSAKFLTSVDGALYFVADDDIHGAELWSLGPDPDAVARGDYDQDGDADGADFLKWQRNVGSRDATADGDGSGVIDGGDLQVWRDHFGTVSDSATASVQMASSQPAAAVTTEFDAATAAGLAYQRDAKTAFNTSTTQMSRKELVATGHPGTASAAQEELPITVLGFGKYAEALAMDAGEDGEVDAAWTTAFDEFEAIGVSFADRPGS